MVLNLRSQQFDFLFVEIWSERFKIQIKLIIDQ